MKKWIATLVAGSLLAVATAQADKSAGDVVDDSTVNASVKAELVGNKITKANNINVETYKGVVQLSGFVGSQAEKDEAGRVAAGVDGVKSVSNNLSIGSKTSMGTKLDDSVTTGKVKTALMDADDVKSGQINVETKAGVVQLSGFVSSASHEEQGRRGRQGRRRREGRAERTGRQAVADQADGPPGVHVHTAGPHVAERAADLAVGRPLLDRHPCRELHRGQELRLDARR